MSATLLPIPSGTWTRPRPDIQGDHVEAVEVITMWVAETGHATALVRASSGALEVEHVVSLRLARPDPATTLDGVLKQLDTLRESTAWAPAGDPVARVHRELGRILEAARAGA